MDSDSKVLTDGKAITRCHCDYYAHLLSGEEGGAPQPVLNVRD